MLWFATEPCCLSPHLVGATTEKKGGRGVTVDAKPPRPPKKLTQPKAPGGQQKTIHCIILQRVMDTTFGEDSKEQHTNFEEHVKEHHPNVVIMNEQYI